MPGRPAKPTNLKILHGDRKDRININEPKPIPIAPECPEHLNDEAKRIWYEVGGELEKLGLLTAIDGDMFSSYCWLTALEKALMKQLEEEGVLHKTPNAHTMPKAQFTILRDLLKLKKEYANLFGLTPASRCKLNVAPQVEDSEMDKMIDW